MFTFDFSAAIHGNGLDVGSRLDIATDVAHAVTYIHTYTGVQFFSHHSESVIKTLGNLGSFNFLEVKRSEK